MIHKLSRWGIGPHIAFGVLLYVAAAGAASHRWTLLCTFYLLPYSVLAVVAGILLLIGLLMLATAAHLIMAAYEHDQLVTTGIAGLVRHPIYSAWIVFFVPALALLSRSWPLFSCRLWCTWFSRFSSTEKMNTLTIISDRSMSIIEPA